jgi:hypothetical protein
VQGQMVQGQMVQGQMVQGQMVQGVHTGRAPLPPPPTAPAVVRDRDGGGRNAVGGNGLAMDQARTETQRARRDSSPSGIRFTAVHPPARGGVR